MSGQEKGNPMYVSLTYAADELLIAAVKLANNGDHKTAERMDVARERVLAARDEIQGRSA